MAANHQDTLRYEFVASPDSSTSTSLSHVGTYKRTVPVNLDRMYENALDWEHLPYLHESSFGAIKVLASGAWGWRAEVTGLDGSLSVLELSLDRSCRRWITRNLEGPNQGAEIWTHVFVSGEQSLDLVIDFFVPGVPLEARNKVGAAYAAAYERLYDEDVSMMTHRQQQIDLRLDAVDESASVTLEVTQETPLPVSFELSGRAYLLHWHDDRWLTYPANCPHQMGPLSHEIDADGTVRCPWHGYRFDVQSGACVTGAACRFGRVPEVVSVQDKADDKSQGARVAVTLGFSS